MMIYALLSLLFVAMPQANVFKAEMEPLQAAIDGAASSVGARVMQDSKAAYIEGYGIVVAVEVALEAPRNPFSAAKTSEEIRRTIDQRRAAIRTRLSEVLKEQTAKTKSVGPDEVITIVVHLMNTNPADVPNLPLQLVFSARKSAPNSVTVREV